MAHSLRIRSAFAASLFAFAAFGLAQSNNAVSRDRVLGPIVESDVVTLVGNTHPMARPEFDRGPVSAETRLDRMVLLLQPDSRQQKALDALVEAQQEPSSGEYHQWLSPAEFGAHFGVSAGDLTRIAAWLESHGFAVERFPAGRRLVVFSGTAAQVAEAFHTEIHQYDLNGEAHIANSEDPQIPRALASVVAGVVSLHDFRRISAIHSRRAVASPENTQGGTHYLFPADFATIYDLNPQYAAGQNGLGASIAIVGRSNINLSDVSSFRSFAGLTANQPTVILDGANPGLVSGDQDESTLDVEWSGGVAPGAAVKFVVAASTATTDGVDLSAQYIVNHKTATAMSTSYGNCEADMGSAEMAFYNNLWEQAASEGISAFVSSGDSGAAGCSSGSASKGSGTGVNGLCSSSYSTCVGGTEFNEGSGKYWATTNGAGGGSALSYIPEKVWNESAIDGGSGLWSSGGGISQVYTQPSWQKGISGATSNGMRAVPDVALTAAGHDGYLICEDGSWYVIAGTSAASPSFAGMMSVVDQKQGGTGQGNVNPTLYKLAAVSGNPFHPTPSGNNSVPGVTGFTASGASYNLATGLGSADANLLVDQWPGPVAAQPAFTLKPSVTSETLLPGKSVTFTIAVAGTNGFAGSVALTAKTPTGVSLTFSPSTVKAGGSATATLSVASGTVAVSNSVAITGTSATAGVIPESATVALTIQAAPKLSLSTGVTSIALTQGKTVQIVLVSTTSGAFSGPVALAVTGLPAGVTASWSDATFTVSGSSSTVSTLSLKATSNTVPSSGTLKISATGDGLQSLISCAVQVVKAAAVKKLPPQL